MRPMIAARPSTPPTTPPTIAPVLLPPLELAAVADAEADDADAAAAESIDDNDVVEDVEEIAVEGRVGIFVLPAPAGSHMSIL